MIDARRTRLRAATLTMGLVTQVQAPYELYGLEFVSSSAAVTPHTGILGRDDDTGANGLRRDAECTDPAVDCLNNWQFSIDADVGACTFDGTYVVSFKIRCSPTDQSSCPIDTATDDVTLEFSVISTHHCARVVEDIDLTASIAVYGDAAHTDPKDDFLDTQTLYFKASVAAEQAAIRETEFSFFQIQRTSTPQDDDVTLMDAASGTLNYAAATADNGPFLLRHDVGGAPATITDNSHATLQITMNTTHLGFVDDQIEEMRVAATIDVRYLNDIAAKGRAGQRLLDEEKSQAVTVVTSMRTQFPDQPTDPAPGDDDSSEAATATVSPVALYAAAAVFATVAIALVVVARRRCRRPASTTKSSMRREDSRAQLADADAGHPMTLSSSSAYLGETADLPNEGGTEGTE